MQGDFNTQYTYIILVTIIKYINFEYIIGCYCFLYL